MSYSVCYSFQMFIRVSRHISFPTMFILFLICQFSCHNLGLTMCNFHFSRPTVCVSHFTCVSVFLANLMSHYVSFSFSSFVIFLAILQVLQCAIFIFHGFQCFSLYFKSFIVVSHFPRFSDLSPKSRYYCLYF